MITIPVSSSTEEISNREILRIISTLDSTVSQIVEGIEGNKTQVSSLDSTTSKAVEDLVGLKAEVSSLQSSVDKLGQQVKGCVDSLKIWRYVRACRTSGTEVT